MGIDDEVKKSEDAFKKDESGPLIPGKDWYDKPCAACAEKIETDGLIVINKDMGDKKEYYHTNCFNKNYIPKKTEDGNSK